MKQQNIQTKTFENGLTLIVEPMDDVQSAAVSLLVPAGSVFDPPGQNGSASVLCEWIPRGAGDRDSKQLSAALDNLGVQHSESVGPRPFDFHRRDAGREPAASLAPLCRYDVAALAAGGPIRGGPVRRRTIADGDRGRAASENHPRTPSTLFRRAVGPSSGGDTRRPGGPLAAIRPRSLRTLLPSRRGDLRHRRQRRFR